MNTRSEPKSIAVSLEQGPVVGVKTTRIYCRVSCRPGRAPRRENCVPFASASAARAAGYRPCKQCRPDEVRTMSTIFHGTHDTRLGPMFAARTEKGVCALFLIEPRNDEAAALDRLARTFPKAALTESPVAVKAAIEGAAAHVYDGQPWDDVPLDLQGTPFQLKVWERLRAIPRGETTSYGELARSMGLASVAARAVGTACGANLVSILVPCHRVLRTGGGLGGYYWGLEIKRALLELEGVLIPEVQGTLSTV